MHISTFQGLFDWIFQPILDAIVTALLNLFWFIFIQGPLNLIAAFTKVLEYLTGGIINDLLFGSAKDFSWDKIPTQFFWFVIVAICLFALIFTIQMIILIFQEATETKTKFVLAIQNGVKAFIFMFLIPIFFFIANFIIQNFANTIINNFGNHNNIADYLWHIGDKYWNGTANGVPSDYGPPGNIRSYNLIVQIFGTWFMLFAIAIIGITLIQKVIELFFLFIISPLVMIVMVIDNGRAAFTWKDMVIAKFLASSATLISYYIYMSAIQILLKSGLEGLDASDFAKQLFIVLFLCAGGLATLGFSDMVAGFIGEGVGIREGRASFQSTLRGGFMALGVGKLIAKPFKIAKKGLKQINEVNKKFKNNSDNNSDASDSSDNSSESRWEIPKMNLNPFHSATKSMASRSGIVGLAGKSINEFGNSLGNVAARTVKKLNNKKAIKTSSKIPNIKTIENRKVSIKPNPLANRNINKIKQENKAKELSLQEKHIIKMNNKIKKYQPKTKRNKN